MKTGLMTTTRTGPYTLTLDVNFNAKHRRGLRRFGFGYLVTSGLDRGLSKKNKDRVFEWTRRLARMTPF